MKPLKELACYISLPLALAASVAFKTINTQHTLKAIQQDNPAPGFAVVELFTSEGCSSCPPADEIIAQLQQSAGKQLYIMAFHVDYWDHQGWKDRFSQHTFSERQQQYSRWLRLPNIYTPQLIVNGTTQMIGSDEGAVFGSIQNALQTATTTPLSLKAEQHAREITVSWSGGAAPKKAQMLMALVQKSAGSRVVAGENAGRQLSHVQIVRQLQQQEMKEQGALSLKLPDDFQKNDWEIIAFVQEKTSGKVIQASKVVW
ncbi:DUF1223 domain-containing protein [Chitinophaga qingshengii]|uniref:DUF1223 domain-containing protein n=1 Tax=Chitinophaga qingshengii TaxID=1569794 RepID=A0ABR7TI79_9BACT|nr:DUF1223 domain-containing protein [Chitinophaga qingshengii]MBC9929218.1 DUF1223 domain-containing protein [Chitinophaga qingshengii]